ncbi:MAG: carboxypeptidase regulatory-like domain-containing protein [Planctomycetes bacterium]|nr:carboxypeptidase regulatory-like domain-containing protein [Planctomycetota bacterium]
MSSARTFGLAVLLVLVAAAVTWLLTRGDGTDLTPAAGPAAQASPGAAAPAAVAETTGPGAGTDAATQRVLAPSDPASAAAAIGHGLLGRVVDDQGTPVAGAAVRCTPGWGGGQGLQDFQDFDFEELADFDPAALAERFRAQQGQAAEATTDPDGRFRIVAPGQGRNVQLRVSARHHVVLDRSVPRPAAQDDDLGTLTLQRGALVAGRVVDRSGNPVAAARVQRIGKGAGPGFLDFEFPGAEAFEGMAGEELAVTAADGRFELVHCAAGEFGLRARHADHPAAFLDGLSAPPGGQLTGLVVVVEPGAEIRGTVVGLPAEHPPLRVMASLRREGGRGSDENGGNALSFVFGQDGPNLVDAGFGIGEKQVDLAADHTFVLRGLQVGKTYRVWGAQTGRGLAGNSACTQRLEVASGISGLELRYDAGIEVTLQVVDGRTGEPIERLWVRDQLRGGGGLEDLMAFVPRGGRSKHFPDGRVTLANLRPKPKQVLTLAVEAIGYARAERRDLALPVTGSLDLGTWKLDPAPVVRVAVTAGPEGRPVAGAAVRLAEAQAGPGGADPFAQIAALGQELGGGGGTRAGRTDAEGRCVLNAFPGPQRVTVTAADFAPDTSAPIEATPAGVDHLVQLVRGGSVEVAVTGEDGKPLAKARIDHAAPGGERKAQEADGEGRTVFEHLAPGEHRFRLARRQGDGAEWLTARVAGATGQPPADPDWRTVQIEDGVRSSLQLAKAATASLRGVVRENGVPLAGARVSFAEGAEDRGGGTNLEQRFAEAMGEMGGGGGRGRSARTEPDGSYRLAELPAGAHRLRVTSRDRAMPATVPVTLRLGENVLDVDLDASVLRGTVRDGQGNPVAGASVAIVPVRGGAGAGARDERSARIEEMLGGVDPGQFGGGGRGRGQVKSRADGRYELRGAEPGSSVQVRASAKGFAAALSAPVQVPLAGDRDGVDVVLGAAGTIEVRLAAAPPFAQVVATRVGEDGSAVDGVRPVTQVLRSGKATLDGLAPGRWKVTVRSMGGNDPAPQFVLVEAGRTATVAF